jgi:hypothetical protein
MLTRVRQDLLKATLLAMYDSFVSFIFLHLLLCSLSEPNPFLLCPHSENQQEFNSKVGSRSFLRTYVLKLEIQLKSSALNVYLNPRHLPLYPHLFLSQATNLPLAPRTHLSVTAHGH